MRNVFLDLTLTNEQALDLVLAIRAYTLDFPDETGQLAELGQDIDDALRSTSDKSIVFVEWSYDHE